MIPTPEQKQNNYEFFCSKKEGECKNCLTFQSFDYLIPKGTTFADFKKTYKCKNCHCTFVSLADANRELYGKDYNSKECKHCGETMDECECEDDEDSSNTAANTANIASVLFN